MFAQSAIIKILDVILVFILNIIIARYLGASELGVYTLYLSSINIALLFSIFGTTKLVARETAYSDVEGENKSITFSISFSFLMTFFTILIFFLLNYKVFELDFSVIFGLSSVIFLRTLIGILTAILLGQKKIYQSIFFEKIIPSIFFLVLLLSIFPLQKEVDSELILFLYLLSMFTGLLCIIFFSQIIKYIKKCWNYSSKGENKVFMKSSFFFFSIAGVQQININIDVLSIGFFSSIENVGIYKVALQFSSLLTIGIQVSAIFLLPHIIGAIKNDNKNELVRIARLSASFSFFISAVAYVFLFSTKDYLLVSIYGEGFDNSIFPLLILGAFQVINSFFGSIAMIASSLKEEKEVSRAIGIAAIINVVLNVPLIHLFSIEGAALSTGISILFWNVYIWRVLYIKHQINYLNYLNFMKV